MRAAFTIGISLAEYNELTPWELSMQLEAHRDRRKYEDEVSTERLITQAWLTAVWQRSKKIPDLDKTLDKIKKKNEPAKVQTAEDMLEVLKKVNAALGGKVY